MAVLGFGLRLHCYGIIIIIIIIIIIAIFILEYV